MCRILILADIRPFMLWQYLVWVRTFYLNLFQDAVHIFAKVVKNFPEVMKTLNSYLCTYRNFCIPHYRNFCEKHAKADETSLNVYICRICKIKDGSNSYLFDFQTFHSYKIIFAYQLLSTSDCSKFSDSLHKGLLSRCTI